MVEIIVHPSEDTITMAIECAPAIMDMQLARKAVDCWSEMVGSLWESAQSRCHDLYEQYPSILVLSHCTR
jgi:hypothetical protein